VKPAFRVADAAIGRAIAQLKEGEAEGEGGCPETGVVATAVMVQDTFLATVPVAEAAGDLAVAAAAGTIPGATGVIIQGGGPHLQGRPDLEIAGPPLLGVQAQGVSAVVHPAGVAQTAAVAPLPPTGKLATEGPQ